MTADGRRRRTTVKRDTPIFRVGEGVVDTTPPVGVELAGFHRKPGEERIATGTRQPTAARALVLDMGKTQAAIVSLDICAVSQAMARRVQTRIEKELGIPFENVQICATHTHSMPTFRYFRQWGAIPNKYMAMVEDRIVEAVEIAQIDLARADLSVGKSNVEGANFNRTIDTWKTDREFGEDSTDDERWLDTTLHTLFFKRPGRKRNILWYHFSCHPVCYSDDQAGPDWPGLVEDLVIKNQKLSPSFLQGHSGDVNPGMGDPWIGDPMETASRVYDAIVQALANQEKVKIDGLKISGAQVKVPLDMECFNDQLERYREDPSKCNEGEWVDAGFAEDWYRATSKRNLDQRSFPTSISAIRIGDLGLLFHTAELYSFYGLSIRHRSPFKNTLVVGYTDGFIGYLPDPKAFADGEYAATTVPMILDLPPYAPQVARVLTDAAVELLEVSPLQLCALPSRTAVNCGMGFDSPPTRFVSEGLRRSSDVRSDVEGVDVEVFQQNDSVRPSSSLLASIRNARSVRSSLC